MTMDVILNGRGATEGSYCGIGCNDNEGSGGGNYCGVMVAKMVAGGNCVLV